MDYTLLLKNLLAVCDSKRASDLHLKVGIKPTMRVTNELVPISDQGITLEMMEGMMRVILTPKQQQEFERDKDIDLAFNLEGLQQRYRANIYYDINGISISIRRFGVSISDLASLGIPDIVRAMSLRKNGLILVTGPTGSGKSTTLASIINYLNDNVNSHIITLEDPIEFIHKCNKCIITQREVGKDASSFARGLREALRQDPDIIMLGEMRDLESISTALTAAETGHLVLATLHTTGAENAIDRIIDSFPAGQQEQIRVQLAMTLLCIVSQQLIPRAKGDGRVLATEVMVTSSAIRSIIRQGKTFQIGNTMSTSKKQGMYTINQCLDELFKNGEISAESYKLFQTNQINLAP